MARAAATTVENNFVHGLITEATGMNFPENAASDTFDCVFKPIGAVQRRQGFQPEPNGVFQPVTDDINSISEYTWYSVADVGSLSFVVQQVGMTLYFFAVTAAALSPGLMSSTIDLNDFRVAGSPSTSDGTVCQYAAGYGRLFVTHPYCEPFYVTYDIGSATFSGTEISLLIRDFKRQEDGLAIDERPTVLSNLHKYNLYNQGWYYVTPWASNEDNTHLHGPGVVLDDYHTGSDTLHDYPSNADIWWIAKNASDTFTPSLIQKIMLGNSYAPNGHYVMNPFATDREAQSGITGVPENTAGSARPSTVAFYEGRAWYGGVNAQGYGSQIYFSQILEDVNQSGKCFQENDPTSEQNSDLLPSDGGVLVIPGMGSLLKLYPLVHSLVCVASNGVWQIAGSSGAGFFANDYSVQKVAEHGGVGSMSVVETEGILLWMNYYGIYALSMAQTGIAQVQSVSDSTIKQFYLEIPQSEIPFIKGAYNRQDFLCQWLYRSTSATTTSESFQYDRVLNLRTNTQAFYPWTISTALEVAGAPSVSGLVAIKGQGTSRTDDTVVSNGETVILA